MKRNLVAATELAAVAAVAAAAAATLVLPRSAFAAGDITIDPVQFVSTATRAQVRGEILGPQQFAHDSEWGRQQPDEPVFKSSITKQQSREAYRTARREVSALTGEDSGSNWIKQHPQQPDTAMMGGPAR